MPTSAVIAVSPLRDAADACAFHDLNERWITAHFAMEDADRAVLLDPERAIVAAGGTVLIARDGDERVGCVALLRTGDDVVEVAKMAVTPSRQGEGIGRLLLTAAIETARAQGVRRVLLESNRRLVPAVRLYESMGFRHVPPESHAPTPYARADVFMDLDLD